MKKWYNIAAILMVTVIVIGVFAIGCAKPTIPQATGPVIINIGTPVPLSGMAANWGSVPTPFYEAFLELFNKEGFQAGGKTYNLKLIQIDDQNTPEGGAAAARQLIEGNKCKFIVGHWSWNFPTVSDVTNKAKVILITRTGNEAVPKSWGGLYDPQTMPYVVFGHPSQEEYLGDALAIVKAIPDYKVLGMLDSTLGQGAGWTNVDGTLDAVGVKYHHEWYTPGTTDFTPYITKMAEAGCGVVFTAGDVGSTMLFAKQRWEMGYTDMRIGHSGPILDPAVYIMVCGKDAVQGLIGSYYAPWDFKDTQVNPKWITMCQEAMSIVTEAQGKPYVYTGGIGWLPTQAMILAQAMEKAGTVDDTDAIMQAMRGGTFDTPIGTYTMSGAQTYGSAVVFGNPNAISEIQGEKEVYLSEQPWKPIP